MSELISQTILIDKDGAKDANNSLLGQITRKDSNIGEAKVKDIFDPDFIDFLSHICKEGAKLYAKDWEVGSGSNNVHFNPTITFRISGFICENRKR